nr:cytochrome P450 [Agasicles hygrophila]
MDYYLGHIFQILSAILLAIKNYARIFILAWKLPGPPGLPILGNVLTLRNQDELVHLGTYSSKLYGTIMRLWVSLLPTIYIMDPRHLKIILSTNKNNQKGLFYEVLHNFIGRGLITNSGYKWKKNRKLVQPYFHINILEKFLDTFIDCSQSFVSRLEGNETVKITTYINECVLDILHNGVLGVPLDLNSPYRQGELQALERFIKPWLLLEPIFQFTSSAKYEQKQRHNLHSYTKEILTQRLKTAKKSSRTCFLDMFIEISENSPEFTEEDIINETVTFMLAGQDSVGATLAFALYYIAKNQEVQEQIINEITLMDINDRVTLKDLNNMKYLEQVIKETLRLAPAVPMITRVLTEDVALDKTILPKGTNIFISPFTTHRLEEYFHDPLKFIPDRFEENNLEKIHPYAFLPFSLGPRNCIGSKFAILELKTLLYYFLKKFEIVIPPGREDLKFSYRATLRARGGIWLNLYSKMLQFVVQCYGNLIS